MQVLLRKSDTRQDIQCTICQQGFRIYWERTSPAERDTMRAIVHGELCRQHEVDKSEAAHPELPFTVPQWSGAAQYSGAALLGGLTSIHRTAPLRRQSR